MSKRIAEIWNNFGFFFRILQASGYHFVQNCVHSRPCFRKPHLCWSQPVSQLQQIFLSKSSGVNYSAVNLLNDIVICIVLPAPPCRRFLNPMPFLNLKIKSVTVLYSSSFSGCQFFGFESIFNSCRDVIQISEVNNQVTSLLFIGVH